MLKYERGKEQFHDNESRMRVVEPTQEGVELGKILLHKALLIIFKRYKDVLHLRMRTYLLKSHF